MLKKLIVLNLTKMEKTLKIEQINKYHKKAF